jgi:hypothetical protein
MNTATFTEKRKIKIIHPVSNCFTSQWLDYLFGRDELFSRLDSVDIDADLTVDDIQSQDVDKINI